MTALKKWSMKYGCCSAPVVMWTKFGPAQFTTAPPTTAPLSQPCLPSVRLTILVTCRGGAMGWWMRAREGCCGQAQGTEIGICLLCHSAPLSASALFCATLFHASLLCTSRGFLLCQHSRFFLSCWLSFVHQLGPFVKEGCWEIRFRLCSWNGGSPLPSFKNGLDLCGSSPKDHMGFAQQQQAGLPHSHVTFHLTIVLFSVRVARSN